MRAWHSPRATAIQYPLASPTTVPRSSGACQFEIEYDFVLDGKQAAQQRVRLHAEIGLAQHERAADGKPVRQSLDVECNPHLPLLTMYLDPNFGGELRGFAGDLQGLDTDEGKPVGLQVVLAEQVLPCALYGFRRDDTGEGRAQRGSVRRIVDFQLIEPEYQIKAAVRSSAGWQVEKSRELR